MRCLIIQNRLGLDGRSRCVVEFVRLLNELGVEPQVFCLAYEDSDIGRAFGVTGLRYSLSRVFTGRPAVTAFSPEVLLSNLLAGRMIRDTRPDLVFNSNCVWTFLPAGPRYIHYIHFSLKAVIREFPRYQSGFWKAYGRILRRFIADRVPPHSLFVANSELVRAGLREDQGLDSMVVYPPSWHGELQPCRPERRRVVTVGAFRSDKRQLEQIEIARRLPDWSFTLLGAIGSRRYTRAVERAASGLSNVTVETNPTRGRIDEELGRASHFLHTHRTEGFGIAVVEAAAAGCVPIVPDSGGVREIVEPAELRFDTIAGCVDALRETSGELGCRLLGTVQERLPRFSDDAFRAALKEVLVEERAIA